MPSTKKYTLEKLKRKLKTVFLDAIQGTPFQFRAYRSYWHYRLHQVYAKGERVVSSSPCFMAQQPNYGAGIGHQLANWNAGYYFSRYYGLGFAHFPFSNSRWEQLLGFGENETGAQALLADPAFRSVQLPRFNSQDPQQVSLIANIIAAHRNKKTLFLLEQDQAYPEQCGTHADLSQKFLQASARSGNNLFYPAGSLAIALHIRRGDIVSMKQADSSNWAQRWLNNDYYAAVLRKVLAQLPAGCRYDIYLFSEGTEKDFPEFGQFEGLHYCLDVNAYDTFLHLVYADILISSKSSFSYKPALISKGIKICPDGFWHNYPQAPEFITASPSGDFDAQQLSAALAEKLKPAALTGE